MEEQKQAVLALLQQAGHFDAATNEAAVEWLYTSLGLPSLYFAHTPVQDIANHILSLQAAKILAQTSGNSFDIQLRQESKDSALFATRSFVKTTAGKTTRLALQDTVSPVLVVERYIENKYLSGSVSAGDEAPAASSSSQMRLQVPVESLSFVPSQAAPHDPRVFRLQAFRSSGVLDTASGVHLRLYLLQAPDFANASPSEGETDIQQLGDRQFLARTDTKMLDAYQRIMTKAVGTLGPAIEVLPDAVEDQDGRRSSVVMVAHRVGTTHSYFTGIPDVYRSHGMYATHKFVEPFANKMVVFTFLLRVLDQQTAPKVDLPTLLSRVAKDASLHYVLPRTSLTPLLTMGEFSPLEVAYAYAAWKFAFHFLSRSNEEFSQVTSALRAAKSEAVAVLGKLRLALKTHAFVEGSLLDAIFRNTALVKWLYGDFAARHNPDQKGATLAKDSELSGHVRRSCSTDADLALFNTFLTFNRCVLKTNLYRPNKTALSFRLDPSFLPVSDYPDKPYGVFFVVGSEFRGFHVRFQDIARGGVRLVRSNYSQEFAQNTATIFDECYGLANTQQRKNKDIPEGGSKGIILLNLAHQDKGRVAFQKFVDALLDLLLPHDSVIDHLGRREILFLGPDEGTADYMDWASLHAKSRGYEYWKAFTTGKSQSHGGIPHDVYGMTTHSVRAYVNGIQRKLGLDGSTLYKVQTGGPDGDLGSNEIKQGVEKTTAVVDGSGVLYDAQGLDPAELRRLAGLRKPVEHFDRSKLSKEGFLVLVSDKDFKLPNGSVVENGTSFRNSFHLSEWACGDFFVPCGGRPAAVNGDNVKTFLYRPLDGEKRVLRYKYIVEGANLFFTQDARLALEAAGVVLFKDASANKGGVTSSSLEVLAALSLTDEEFSQHMQVKDASNPPAFYSAYVAEVQGIICRNAELEFECLWNESLRTGESRSVLSDRLSLRITTLSVEIAQSDSLWSNVALRNKVLRNAIPKTLAEGVSGFEVVLQRIPESYARALFASHLASRFVYSTGLAQSDFAFYEFVEKYV